MKVEVELAKRMIKRSVPLYALVLVITLFISQEAFVTGIIASFTVTFVFLLNAYTQSYTAAISIKLYYFSSLFGYFIRVGLTIIILVLFNLAYPMDLVILAVSVTALFLGMLGLEAFMLLKKDKDLDWIE
tara:strand:+ start:2173 stop:2562 length:390 start_codon:yes stop_codon:yes gene_type:complete